MKVRYAGVCSIPFSFLYHTRSISKNKKGENTSASPNTTRMSAFIPVYNNSNSLITEVLYHLLIHLSQNIKPPPRGAVTQHRSHSHQELRCRRIPSLLRNCLSFGCVCIIFYVKSMPSSLREAHFSQLFQKGHP